MSLNIIKMIGDNKTDYFRIIPKLPLWLLL